MPDKVSAEPFPFEELIVNAPANVKEAYLERSAAFEAGDLVREMRERGRLTQKELARLVHTSQSHLSEIERGNGLQGPTFSVLRKIAAACNVTLKLEVAEKTEDSSAAHDVAAGWISFLEPERRHHLAALMGVADDELGQTIVDARSRALAVLSKARLDQLLSGDADSVRSFLGWLLEASVFESG